MEADELKHGRRPPHKGLKPSKSSPIPGERKDRHAVKQLPSSLSVEDVDSEDSHGGHGDRREISATTGLEGAVLQNAEQLMYFRTLFVNAFPNVMTLNTWVREVWEEAEDQLGDAEQSGKSRRLVRGTPQVSQGELNLLEKLLKYHSRIRSHFLSDMKGKFPLLFKLNKFEDPDELAEQIEYLLENDRFLCPEENYKVR